MYVPAQFYTRKEVAQLLRLSERTIDRMVANGELKAIKIRSAIRIFSDSVESFLKRSIGGEQ